MNINPLTLPLFLSAHLLLASNPPVTVVSFGSNHGLIMVMAEVDGKSGFFILDTGAPDLILNQRIFHGTETDELFRDINGADLNMQAKTVRLSIGGFKMIADAFITDFTSIEEATNLHVLGVIGNSIFKNTEVVFDFVFKELTIYRLDRKGDPLQVRSLHEPPLEAMPFELKGSMPVIDIFIGGQNRKMAIDSGAGMNVLDEEHRLDIEPWVEQMEEKYLVGFGREPKLTPAVLVAKSSVGAIQCPPMRTFLVSLKDLNEELPGPKLDGIIGFEFLSRYRVAINYKKMEFRIWNSKMVEEQFAMAKSRRD